jgi:hypothetical protein
MVDDVMLHTFAVVGEPAAAGKAFATKLSGLVDRATAYAAYRVDPSVWPDFLAAARSTAESLDGGHLGDG